MSLSVINGQAWKILKLNKIKYFHSVPRFQLKLALLGFSINGFKNDKVIQKCLEFQNDYFFKKTDWFFGKSSLNH